MPNKALHILICTGWYKNSKEPFDGVFVEQQARLLQNAGHKVTVLHPHLNGSFKDTLKGNFVKSFQEMDNGILTVRIGVNVLFPRMRNYYYKRLCKKSKNWFKKYINTEFPPDLIHSHIVFLGGVVALSLSKSYSIPFVHTEHTSGLIHDPKQYDQKDIFLLKEVYHFAKKVLFVSTYSMQKTKEIYKLSPKNLAVLPNLIDDIFFSPLEPIPSLPYRYLIVASFIDRKGYKNLFYAWKTVHEIYPDSKLIIIGKGPQKAELYKLSLELNINSSLVWFSELPPEEIKKKIDSSHFLVSTSIVETFGMSVAESLARGRPVVCTDSGGVRDSMFPGAGFLVPQNNISALAEALLKIVENNTIFSPTEISEQCKKRFSGEIILFRLESTYNEIIDNG